MAHNAKKGGEIGANGEYYKGGQFVADSPYTLKGDYTKKKSKKFNREIAPYKWQVLDALTLSLFSEMGSNFVELMDHFGKWDRPVNHTWEDAQKEQELSADEIAVYEWFAKKYIAGERTANIDELIKKFGEGYFYNRYCKKYLEKNYPYFDENKVKKNW